MKKLNDSNISNAAALLTPISRFPRLVMAALLAIWCCAANDARAQSRIYYTVNHPDYHDASMAANGTDKHADTRGEPSYYLHGGQRWFLQFRAVAGTRLDGRDRYEVFAVSQDETSVVQLTDDPNFAPNAFRWLKNDGAISYSGVHFHGGPLDGDSHIVRLTLSEVGGVLASTGVAAVVATAGVTVVSGPSLQCDIRSHDWAPSGTDLVFADAPGYNAGYSVFLIRRVNVPTGVVSLIFDGGLEPVYAPSGTEIAFRGWSSSTHGPQAPGIYAVRPDGSGLRMIVKDSQSTLSHVPSWSPNGASLAFNRQTTTYDRKSTYYYTYTHDILSAPSAGGNGAKFTNLTGDTANYVFLTGWR